MSDSVRPHRWQPTRLPCPWDSPGKNTGVGCHFLLQCMKVRSESEVAQSCPTLRDPMDCSPPGSSVHGILQARILEPVAIFFSRGSSQPWDRTQFSHIAGRRFNLCTTREALKYKNTVSQKTSYRDTELQIQVLTSKISKGGKEARLKEEEGGGGRVGAEGVALQTSPATYRYPGITGLFPGPPEKGGLELGPTRNQTRPEPEFEFSAKRR